MITVEEYFGRWADHEDATPECRAAAEELLSRVNALLTASGISPPVNPVTGNQISANKFGGFRPQFVPIGAPHSAHKEGRAVDVYDPGNALDHWITDERLEEFDLYREHPTTTHGWSHLTTRAPDSGKRTFWP